VEERTAALTATNQSLLQEILERKEAEKFLQASGDRFGKNPYSMPP
jgi:C4-dicarboxylate-specific signal transduction histidine kinase